MKNRQKKTVVSVR